MVGDDAEFKRFVTNYVGLLDVKASHSKWGKFQEAANNTMDIAAVRSGASNRIDSAAQARGASIGSLEKGEGRFILDRTKLDVRVFLVPQNESTLAHYLAMYDDLYCHNVYNYFS